MGPSYAGVVNAGDVQFESPMNDRNSVNEIRDPATACKRIKRQPPENESESKIIKESTAKESM